MRTALSIAGSDSSGGAGIQADIKTMTMHGVFAMTAVTALTAQNTLGVTGILDVTPEFLSKELDAVFVDIFPDAVKVGMVSSSSLIDVIADKLKQYGAKKIVVDPVMVATNGAKLICNDAIETLKSKLIPMADIITPNRPEAEVLTGLPIKTISDMEKAAFQIYEKFGCAVLMKGGHDLNDANDLLWSESGPEWFYGKRIDNPNTHGTGCTLSSAIASNLALDKDIATSVRLSKDFISDALCAKINLGHGKGPINHTFSLSV